MKPSRFSYHTEYALDSLAEDAVLAPDSALLIKLLCPGDQTLCDYIDSPVDTGADAGRWVNMPQEVAEAILREADADAEAQYIKFQTVVNRTANAVDAVAEVAFRRAAAADALWLPDLYRSTRKWFNHAIRQLSDSIAYRVVSEGLTVQDGVTNRWNAVAAIASYARRADLAAELGPGIGWDFMEGLDHYLSLPSHMSDRVDLARTRTIDRVVVPRLDGLECYLVSSKHQRKALVRSLALASAVFGRDSAEALARGAAISFERDYEYRIKVSDIWCEGHGGLQLNCHDRATGTRLAYMCVFIKDTPPLDQAAAFKMMVDADGDEALLKAANLTLDTKAPEELLAPLANIRAKKHLELREAERRRHPDHPENLNLELEWDAFAGPPRPDGSDLEVEAFDRPGPVRVNMPSMIANMERIKDTADRLLPKVVPAVIESVMAAPSLPARPQDGFDPERTWFDAGYARAIPMLASISSADRKLADAMRVEAARARIAGDLETRERNRPRRVTARVNGALPFPDRQDGLVTF